MYAISAKNINSYEIVLFLSLAASFSHITIVGQTHLCSGKDESKNEKGLHFSRDDDSFLGVLYS